MAKHSSPQTERPWLIPARERLDYPTPPTPEADRMLWRCAMAMWKGLDRAIDTDLAGGSKVQIEGRFRTGEIRRALASGAAAYRASGMSETEALMTAQRAAASRMELISRRAVAYVSLCPELGQG
jgi:hypothetical protein